MHEINLSILRISFSKIKITQKLKCSFVTKIQNSLDSNNSHSTNPVSADRCVLKHISKMNFPSWAVLGHKYAIFEPSFLMFSWSK